MSLCPFKRTMSLFVPKCPFVLFTLLERKYRVIVS